MLVQLTARMAQVLTSDTAPSELSKVPSHRTIDAETFA